MSLEQPAVEIAIAVVERDGLFLVGVRDAGAVLAGHDEFPGGKVRPGETPASAAERECLEETGLTVAAFEALLPEIEHTYAHGRVRLHFLRCRPAVRVAAPPRAPFRWVNAEELGKLRFPEANRAALAAIFAAAKPPLP